MEILYFGKNVSPLSCVMLCSKGFVLFVSGRSNDGCRGFRRKNVSPLSGIHLSILPRLFFGSDLLKGRSPLAFCTYCSFCAEGFWFGPFERSKPLGVCFALIVPFVPKVFWFGHFERSKPLGVCFDKYAKFADAGRSLPFGLLRQR